MNDYYKALQFSIAFHALLFLALFSMGNLIPHENKMLVIDFTLENQGQNENSARLIKPTGTIHIKKAEEKNTDQLPEKAKVKEIQITDENVREEIKKEEKHQPVFEYITKLNGSSMQQYVADNTKEKNNVVTEAAPHTGTATINVAGKTFGGGDTHSFDVKRAKYLKANFLYIRELINKKVSYPIEARQKEWEGKVKLAFIILTDGSVRGIQLMQSSGYSILDKSAVEAVKNASPFPKPPAEAQIVIPIVYKLH
jgi:TonB family protein